jgi:AcrR family transcriptional regulator
MSAVRQRELVSSAKTHLISVATRLFAERGINAVAVKDILDAAGQRNQSAIQYHFGSKNALIQAALLSRMDAIDKRRVAMVEAAKAQPAQKQKQILMRACVEPILEETENHPDGSHYARFAAQALQLPDFDAATLLEQKKMSGFMSLVAAVTALRKRPVSQAEAAMRVRLSANLTMSGIANWMERDRVHVSREALIELISLTNEAILLGAGGQT